MPLTGRFNADFGNFLDAVNTATVKVVDMGKGASGVESKLNSMVDNFSGRKLIQDAALMTAAVDAVGGISALTAKQLEQVSAQAQQAADKLTAMGYTVPKGIQEIADAVDDAKAKTGGWIPMVKELGDSWVARITEGILLRDAIRGVISELTKMAGTLPEIALRGAGIADVADNFQNLTQQAGLVSSVLLGQLQAGTHQTITDFELMKIVNKDLGAGLTLSAGQFRTMADGAFALAQSTGVDVKQAFEQMNDAMLKGQARGVAELTGKVDLKAAEEKYAQSLGLTADRLSEGQKIEASRIAILDAVAEATKRVGEQTDGLDEKVAQAATSWENFKDKLGQALATSNVLLGAIDGLGKILVDAFGGSQQAAIDGITTAVDELVIDFVSLGTVGVEVAGFLQKEWIATEKIIGNTVQVLDGVRLAYLLVKEAATFKYDPVTRQLSDDYKRLDDTIASLEIRMKARGDQLQTESQRQADVDKTTAKYKETLEGLVGKLREVQASSKSWSDENLNIFGGITTVTGAVVKHAEALPKAAKGTDDFAKAWKELDSVGAGFQKTLDTVDGAVVEAIKYYLQAGAGVGTLAKAYGLTDLQVKAVEQSVKASTEALKAFNKETEKIEQLHDNTKGLQELATFGQKLDLKPLDTIIGKVHDIERGTIGMGSAMESFGLKIKPSLKDLDSIPKTLLTNVGEAAAKLPNLLVSAFTGGGGILGAIKGLGTTMSSALGDTMFGALKDGKVVGGIFNGLTGAFASAIPAIGPAIGALIGPLISKIANIGGPSQAELDGRKLEAQFEQAAGGFQQMMDQVGKAYAATGHTSQEAQADVKALLDAEKQGPAATQAWIDKIKGIETAAAGLGDLGKGLGDELGAALKVPADALKSYDDLNQKQLDLRTQIDGASGDQKAALEQQLADTDKSLNEAGQLYNATIPRTKAQADALADTVVADFASMIKNGVSFTEAVQKIGPSVTELSDIFGGMGDVVLDTASLGGAAFEHLKGLVGLASDAIAGPAITSVTHLGNAMADLDQLGLGNADTFAALGDQIGATFESLVAQGKDGNDLMIAMRDPLQKLWEEQQKFGITLDDSTQKMLDQAEAQGIVGPEMEDVNKQLLKVMKDIDDTLKAMSGHANDFGNAVTSLPSSKTVEIKTVYSSEGNPAGDGGGATGAWSGGVVGPYGVQHAAFGGNVIAFPGQPQGLDRIPVWMARNEGVVSEQGMGTIGKEGLAAINSGQPLGGGTTVVDTSRQAAETAALRQDLNDLVRLLPKMIRDGSQLAPRAA